MIEAALDPKLLNTLKGHKDQINAVHFHPHGYIFFNKENKLSQVQTIAWYLYGILIPLEVFINILDIKMQLLM